MYNDEPKGLFAFDLLDVDTEKDFESLASDTLKSTKSVTFVKADWRTSSFQQSPRKSMLKNPLSQERIETRIGRLHVPELLLHRLQKGVEVMKLSTIGKVAKRFIWVSPDGTELRWSKVSSIRLLTRRPSLTGFSKIELADCIELFCGPKSHNFRDYDWVHGHPYNCLSLVMPDRTLDLEFDNRGEFMCWYQGLQHFVPLSHTFLNRGKLNWHRLFCKLAQISILVDGCVMDTLVELVHTKGDTETEELSPVDLITQLMHAPKVRLELLQLVQDMRK